MQSYTEYEQDFLNWQGRFLLHAADAGVDTQTLSRYMDHLRFDPRVLEKQSSQSEFTLTITEYLDRAVPDKRVQRGRAQFRTHREMLLKVANQYNVEAHIILAIWGVETNFGAVLGSFPVLSSLSTLAFAGFRASIFESELIAALKILERGDITGTSMLGSWAGAMGHGQFMPSSFLRFGVDSDGDGRSDIWSSDPEDGLASIANYLSLHNWKAGRPTALEVHVPSGFDYSLTGMHTKLTVAEWTNLDILSISGNPVPNYGQSSIILPSGASGPAFMTFGNFETLLTYNRSDAYALAVTQMANRLQGGSRIKGKCSTSLVVLTRDKMKELQKNLTRAGYDTMGADGFSGVNTSLALRNYQRDNGLICDGFASGAMLDHLNMTLGDPEQRILSSA